ncbi:hypothetical protein LCGC14_1152830 [marine sediment metagenome]|uniref:Uncharacterized protein n=1 Tax=marine sediment metagenome TaxID=412755 RepID=A0A0F9LUX6_9ZZZZ
MKEADCRCYQVEMGTARKCLLHHRVPCCYGSAIYGRSGCTCQRSARLCRSCGQTVGGERAQTMLEGTVVYIRNWRDLEDGARRYKEIEPKVWAER